MRTVILMSTYQGERFVAEQLRSILEQLPPDGRVIVRDDGSRDRTPDIVESFKDPRIALQRGANLGFARSFLTLLQHAPADADMLMFSDQDDVWLPGKIERAARALSDQAGKPALYCSAQVLTDEHLQPIEVSGPSPQPPTFARAIAENMVTGCTAALNREAAELLRQAGIPVEVRFHDWWAFVVLVALGHVLVDTEPTLLYRQHAGNIIGRGAGWWQRRVRMVRFLAKHDWPGTLLAQVAALEKHYSNQLSGAQRALIHRYFRIEPGGCRPTWALVLSTMRWRRSLVDEFAFRLMMAYRRIAG